MLLILNTSNTVVGTLARFGTTNKVTPYFDDTHVEDLSSGAETFTFSTFANTKEAYNLTVGNSIAFKVKNGYKLFQITEVTETHNEEFIKSCYCEMVGIELLNEVVRPFSSNSMSLKQFLTTILQDTDYSIGRIDSSLTLTHDIEVTSHTKVYSLLQDYVINKYEAEISFRVEIEGGRIVGKYIDCELERGDFKGTRFEYSKNITNVRKSIDYSELATALIGVGTNDLTFRSITADDKPLNQDFIADENSYALWNKKGKHIFDVYKYETESPTELLNATRKELKRRCNPKFKYEVDVELLTQEVSIGDTVYIIDNEFNPPLHLSARVSQLSTCRTDASQNKCILSNYKEVVSSITDDMRNIAGLIDERFPIKEKDISNGAVTSDKIKEDSIQQSHIVRDSITTEHLQAKVITSDKIEAGQIKAEHILANQIKTAHLQADAVTADKIKAGSIESTHIKANQIDATHIKADAIETDHIKANQVVGSHILAGEIKANHLATNSVTADKIQAGTITGDKIYGGTITGDKIQAGTITGDKISGTTITGDKISAGAITTDKLGANSITSNKIATNQILAGHIKAGEIQATHIKAGAITSDKISAGAITSDKIGANAITSDKISAGSITANKLSTGELITNVAQIKTGLISSAHIGNGQITNAHIGQGAIGSANITEGAILNAHITAGAIDNAKIKDATIESAKIKSINASTINTGTLDASKITVTNLKADSITTGSITVEGNNLLKGTEFKDLTYWGGGTVSTTETHEGANSLKVSFSGYTADKWASVYHTEFLPATEGQAFVISGYMKVMEADSNIYWAMEFFDGNKSRLSRAYCMYSKVTKGFEYKTATAKAPAGTKYVRCRFEFQRNGTAYLCKPMLSKGTIASIYKPHHDELISDGAISSDKIQDEAVGVSKLNLQELFVSDSAFIENLHATKIKASQLEVDTIRNDLINLNGVISFESMNEDLGSIFIRPEGVDKTYINGGTIFAKSISADAIELKGLSIVKDGYSTLAISEEGDISLTGDIASKDYSDVVGNERGYKLSANGDAVLNNAIVRGDVILPNAGMTNYGGSGNPNLVKDTGNSVTINGANTTNQVNYAFNLASSLVDGNDITISFKYSASAGATGTFKLQTGDNYWISFSKSIDVAQAPNGYSTHTITVKVPEGKSFKNFGVRMDNFVGTLTVSEVKVEYGSVATSWCPHISDNFNPVRFWAGASYENRDNAPFKVYQDGSIEATRGNFGGTFTGSLDIGNIHISDTNSTEAVLEIKDNNDVNTKIRLTDKSAEYFVPLKVGDTLGVNPATGSVDFGKGTALKLLHSNSAFGVSLNTSSDAGYHAFEIKNNEGATHSFITKAGYSGVVVQSTGANVGGFDWKFRRESGSHNAVVQVEGNLVVSRKITMADNNKIELVSIGGTNSGIDFMIR